MPASEDTASNKGSSAIIATLMEPRRSRLICAAIALVLLASPAQGDVLAPGTFVIYGYVLELHLAMAVLLIETAIARRILALSVSRSVLLAVVANAVSAVVGALVVVPTTIWMSVRESLEAGAFLTILLCLPLCPLSIWIEGRVATWVLRKSHDRQQCARWAREANLASYLMVAAVSFAVLAASWLYRRRGLI